MTQEPEFPRIDWRENTRGFEELVEAFYTYLKWNKFVHAQDAVLALSELDDPQVFDVLMKFWDEGYDQIVLSYAFANSGDVRALPILRKAVQKDPDNYVAKWAIGMLGEPDYFDDLLELREKLSGISIYEKGLTDEQLAEAIEHIQNRRPK